MRPALRGAKPETAQALGEAAAAVPAVEGQVPNVARERPAAEAWESFLAGPLL